MPIAPEAKRGRLPGGMRPWLARWVLWRSPVLVAELDPVGVDADRQPGLTRLVTDVADWIRVDRPDLVLVVGDVRVRSGVYGSRRVLSIGLPLLLSLTRDEIRALVAHELAALDPNFPELVARLRAHRIAAEWRLTIPMYTAVGRRRLQELLRATEAFVVALEERADAAAVRVAGAQVAARALARAEFVAVDFTDFMADVEDPMASSALNARLVDVHDIWRARLDHGRMVHPPNLRPCAWARLKRSHPTLADMIGALDAPVLDLTRRVDLMDLAPFSDDEWEMLAVALYDDDDFEDWYPLDEVPPEVWTADIDQLYRDTVEEVERVLGREPADIAEYVDVLANRLSEVFPADEEGEYGSAADEPDRGDNGALLTTFAEWILIERGWKRVHPVISALLIAPDGTRHDVRALARQAGDGDTAAQARLVTLLEAAAADPPG